MCGITNTMTNKELEKYFKELCEEAEEWAEYVIEDCNDDI